MLSDKQKPGFSMIELLIVVVIVSIVAGASIVGYRRYKERVDEMSDQTNQLILQTAVKVFATDTGSVAGALSELRDTDIQRAYAMVTEGKKSYTLLAHVKEMWRELGGNSIAEAQTFLPPRYYNNNLAILICPRDLTCPTGFDPITGRPLGGISYEITGPFRGKPLSFLLDPANAAIPIIYEADSTDGMEVYRHERGRAAVRADATGRSGIVVNGAVLACGPDPITGGGTGGVGSSTPPPENTLPPPITGGGSS